MSYMTHQSMGSSIFLSPLRRTKGSSIATGQIISLKKFCESLPSSQSKPSGLNLIRWNKRSYSPNEKQRRLKLENDAVKYRLAQQSCVEKRCRIRSQTKTEPNQPQQMNYKRQFTKILKKQLTATLISQEEEQVFANINEDSSKEQFKRNHRNLWNFIIKKKKSKSKQSQLNTSYKSVLDKQTDYQKKKTEKKELNEKLRAYLKKWNPNDGKAKESRTIPLKKGMSEKTTASVF